MQLWALGTGHILGSPALRVSAGLMALLFNVILKVFPFS